MFLSRLRTITAFVAACLVAILASAVLISTLPGAALSSQDDGGSRKTGEAGDVVAYTVKRSDFVRTTTQPGTVEAFESVNIAPKFSGYLKKLNVDIGDAVEHGQVLAEIDAPEVVAEENKAQTVVEQAITRLASARAAVTVAHAVLEAEKARADAIAATVSRHESILKYREKALNRLQGLAAEKAVERRLVDEAEENCEVARSALSEAKSQTITAKADIEKATAKLVATRAEIEVAKADIHVAQAELENATAVAGYTRIVSPWDGIVTKRGYHVGDFVRSGELGAPMPLLSLIQTGKVKVIVEVPDRDAPYLDKGDRAVVKIDALGGRTYQGAIAHGPGPGPCCSDCQGGDRPQERGWSPAAGPVRNGYRRTSESTRCSVNSSVGSDRANFGRCSGLLSYRQRACGPGPNQDRRGEWQSHGSA